MLCQKASLNATTSKNDLSLQNHLQEELHGQFLVISIIPHHSFESILKRFVPILK
jgi:hypothetical protein